jgi:hypothetical protein
MRKKIAALLAMLMLGGVLTGCGGGNKVATGGEDPNVVPEDTYEINWYMQGMPQEDVASVEAAVNDYLNKNKKVDFTYHYATQFAQKDIELRNLKILHTFLKGQILFIVATCYVCEEVEEYIREQFKVVIPSVFSIEKDKSKEEK